MAIRAWLEEEPADAGKARAPRRRVLLEGLGATAAGEVVGATVHNISETGMLIECAEPLAVDDVLRIDLPGGPDTRASVVWASGRLHGCKFDQPLGTATLSAAMLRSAIAQEDAAFAPASAPSPSPESLGTRLRRLRKSRGMSLADLAAELGVSKPTVWAWEQDRSAPAQDRHERIAHALDTTVSTLQTGRDEDASRMVLERSRQQIAQAFGVELRKVRIMIEL